MFEAVSLLLGIVAIVLLIAWAAAESEIGELQRKLRDERVAHRRTRLGDNADSARECIRYHCPYSAKPHTIGEHFR